MEIIESVTSIVHVLGLGESLEEFVPDDSTTIGVNDIHSQYASDYVVCVDSPKAFSRERAEAIRKTKCEGFYTQVKDWQSVQNYRHIDFAPGRSNLHYLDSPQVVCSNSSPYVAAVIAYKMKAKKIVLHGVDFRTHPNFSRESLESVRIHFRELSKAFASRGVQLYVGSDWSMLSEFLPVWK